MKIINFLLLIIISSQGFSQQNDDFSKRLNAITNQSVVYYNTDGIDFTSQTFNYEFSEKGLSKVYRKYSIKDSDVKTKEESLAFSNFQVTKSEKINDNLNQISSYYFVEDKSKKITVFWFGYYNKSDKEFEKTYINRIVNNEIPKEVFKSLTPTTIDFSGRNIILGNDCYWTNVNTIQCPYNGEMNWSIHKELESAKSSIENQLNVTKSKKGGKVISEEEIDVVFEDTETRAKRIIYDFTGMKSLLAGMSGGKTLTVYYVACKVRENYVSCCMSFWNNDNKTESGLAPLIAEVMQLKK